MPCGFVDVSDVTPETIESITRDQTIGLLHAGEDESFPEADLYDLERVRRGLLAFRDEFRDERIANVGLLHTEESGRTHLALWPDNDRSQAVVIAPRARFNQGGRS